MMAFFSLSEPHLHGHGLRTRSSYPRSAWCWSSLLSQSLAPAAAAPEPTVVPGARLPAAIFLSLGGSLLLGSFWWGSAPLGAQLARLQHQMRTWFSHVQVPDTPPACWTGGPPCLSHSSLCVFTRASPCRSSRWTPRGVGNAWFGRHNTPR